MDGSAGAWRLAIEEPWDLHLALFIRDAGGLSAAASVGPLTEPPSVDALVPPEHRDAATQAWLGCWQSSLAARGPVGGLVEDRGDVQQELRQAQPRRAVAAPPDFGVLAGTPELQQAAVRSWREGFREWWERPAAVGDRGADPSLPIAGVRAQLIAAIMDRSRRHDVQDVVSELEAQRRRKARPFDVTIEVLAVRSGRALKVGPSHALVPLDLYTDSGRYVAWLQDMLAPLA